MKRNTDLTTIESEANKMSYYAGWPNGPKDSMTHNAQSGHDDMSAAQSKLLTSIIRKASGRDLTGTRQQTE